MSAVAYLTDVEGLWAKIEDFTRDNPLVQLTPSGLTLAPGATFVFGGDAIDRGPWSRRVVSALLSAKRRYGDRVVLLAGNRDINKMRLARELSGFPPARAPREVVEQGRAPLLKWIFENTMGAKRAFEMRRAELSSEGFGAAIDDEEVVRSFADDVAPGGQLAEYLAACQLAHRHEATLFVHGAVTGESLGAVPGSDHRIDDMWAKVDRGSQRLLSAAGDGDFDRRLLDSAPGVGPLVVYQAPVPDAPPSSQRRLRPSG
ncbi:MAG: metallophosphoesterase [Polyangiaceae bacterium]